MKYYDLANMEASDALAKKLGFSRIFRNGEGISVQESTRKPQSKKLIITGSNESALARCLKEREVIGILPESEPSKKLLAMLSESGKILFVNVNRTIMAEGKARMKAIYLNRKTMFYCKQFKVKVSPITLANSDEELLSSKQLISIITFLGFLGNGKEAANLIGATYGKAD